jgi:hypothetical protein
VGRALGSFGRAIRRIVRGESRASPERMVRDFIRHSVFVRGFRL